MEKRQMTEELKYLIEFTKIYRSETDKYIREAKCLDCQIRKILVPMTKEEKIVGRVRHTVVGFSPQYGGLYTYFFHNVQVEKMMEQAGSCLTGEEREAVWECWRFWQEEKTVQKLQRRFTEKHGELEVDYKPYGPNIGMDDVRALPGEKTEVIKSLGVGSYPTARIALTIPDDDKLVRMGIPGLRDEVKRKQKENGESSFYTALLMMLDTVCLAADTYRQQAERLADAEPEYREALLKTAHTLKHIQIQAPENFQEGLQLYWLYSVISDQMNTGRMDVFLGDLYVHDLEAGILDEEGAIALLTSLYQQYLFINKVHDTRVIIGGKGRRNEANADRLALAVLETSRRVKDVVPQLTLRYYRGMNEEVLNKALLVVGEGCSFPLLYGDDTNIPAVMKLYGISEVEAEQYIPAGCGEYVIEATSTGTPNCGFNLQKAVELVLHNGDDAYMKCQAGPRTGEPEELGTFDQFWEAYRKQVEPEMLREAWGEAECYYTAAENAGYLQLSLLMNDCLERGRAMLSGGVRYMNGAPEIVGMVTAADSMTAIKKYVYDEKRFTLRQVKDMLDCNFEGFEKERRLFLNAPKYGNNDPEADAMVLKVYDHVARSAIECTETVGLDHYTIVSVNNSASADWGEYTMASACGRKDGDPLANANGASIGADKSGITALLHSMSKYDHSLHSGVINNVRISKELFQNSYEKVKALVCTFLENNGTQLNLMVIGRDDLENAVKHPEEYQNLIVRIGGFSARFVTLNPVIQNEIIKRTTFES